MKYILLFISLLITGNSYATSPIRVEGSIITKINDYSFTNDSIYLSFETECPGMASCVAVRIERSGASIEQLREIKKIIYIAYTLKRRISWSAISSDVLDISKPIILHGDQSLN